MFKLESLLGISFPKNPLGSTEMAPETAGPRAGDGPLLPVPRRWGPGPVVFTNASVKSHGFLIFSYLPCWMVGGQSGGGQGGSLLTKNPECLPSSSTKITCVVDHGSCASTHWSVGFEARNAGVAGELTIVGFDSEHLSSLIILMTKGP